MNKSCHWPGYWLTKKKSPRGTKREKGEFATFGFSTNSSSMQITPNFFFQSVEKNWNPFRWFKKQLIFFSNENWFPINKSHFNGPFESNKILCFCWCCAKTKKIVIKFSKGFVRSELEKYLWAESTITDTNVVSFYRLVHSRLKSHCFIPMFLTPPSATISSHLKKKRCSV